MKASTRPRLLAAILCLIMALIVSGCTPLPIPPPPPGAEETQKPDTLEGLYRLMVGTGFLPDMVPVPQDLVAASYGIDGLWMAESIFMVAQDVSRADEIILIRAANEADAAMILPRLAARLAEKETAAKDSSPDQYAMVLDARTLHEGVDMALIVSPHAGELAKIYQDNK